MIRRDKFHEGNYTEGFCSKMMAVSGRGSREMVPDEERAAARGTGTMWLRRNGSTGGKQTRQGLVGVEAEASGYTQPCESGYGEWEQWKEEGREGGKGA